MDSRACYEKATRLRQKAGGSSHLLTLAKEIGIEVQFEDSYTNLLGMYCYVMRNRFIFLSSRLDDYWLPMVLAHEIGHDQLHRELAGAGLCEFELFNMQSATEYEANAFAAHLLLGSDEIYDALKSGADLPRLAQEQNVNINLLLIKVNEMRALGYEMNFTETADSHFFKKIHV